MSVLTVTISSDLGNKVFRFETANVDSLAEVNHKPGADITDQVLVEALPVTMSELYDGSVTYDYALCYLAEMHRRGLIHGSDFQAELPSAVRPS
jgi:hypothetical protein